MIKTPLQCLVQLRNRKLTLYCKRLTPFTSKCLKALTKLEKASHERDNGYATNIPHRLMAMGKSLAGDGNGNGK